jgi:hypothetical protein
MCTSVNRKYFFEKILFKLIFVASFAFPINRTVVKLSYGVTGNTSVFGTEESRFEP